MKYKNLEIKCNKCGHILMKGSSCELIVKGLTRMGCRKCGESVDLTKLMGKENDDKEDKGITFKI